jgi:hypothetical protein
MTKPPTPPPQPVVINPATMMLPSFLTTTREIQEIVDRSSTELELITNLLSFAMDLIDDEDDFSELSSSEGSRDYSLEKRNPSDRQ